MAINDNNYLKEMFIDEARSALNAKSSADGIEQGRQEAYDEFWDSYQMDGTRRYYMCAFAGSGWTAQNFKPKYDLICSDAYMMFKESPITEIFDILDARGLTLDTSGCATAIYMFQSVTKTTRIGALNISKATVMNNAFDSGAITSIDELICSRTTTFASSTFGSGLLNLTISGEIGKNIWLDRSKKLSYGSITSVMTHLSTTVTGQTATFSKEAVNSAFATSAGAADGSTSAEWEALKAAVPNWTISLI